MSGATIKVIITGFILTMLVSGAAWAQDHLQAFIVAQRSFEQGLAGSEKDNERAAEQFRTLSEQEPGNPFYLAYYGSTFTIMGRDAYLPWKKLKLGEKGLDMIDKALRMLDPAHDSAMLLGVPLSMGTRLVAISTFIKVPDKIFHRYDAGKKLLSDTMKSRLFSAIPPHVQADFHTQAAYVARKDQQGAEEARHLRRILELEQKGKMADAARARLVELGL
jgi:hypothetical protein